jgi:hypothetical protein
MISKMLKEINWVLKWWNFSIYYFFCLSGFYFFTWASNKVVYCMCYKLGLFSQASPQQCYRQKGFFSYNLMGSALAMQTFADQNIMCSTWLYVKMFMVDKSRWLGTQVFTEKFFLIQCWEVTIMFELCLYSFWFNWSGVISSGIGMVPGLKKIGNQ